MLSTAITFYYAARSPFLGYLKVHLPKFVRGKISVSFALEMFLRVQCTRQQRRHMTCIILPPPLPPILTSDFLSLFSSTAFLPYLTTLNLITFKIFNKVYLESSNTSSINLRPKSLASIKVKSPDEMTGDPNGTPSPCGQCAAR